MWFMGCRLVGTNFAHLGDQFWSVGRSFRFLGGLNFQRSGRPLGSQILATIFYAQVTNFNGSGLPLGPILSDLGDPEAQC